MGLVSPMRRSAAISKSIMVVVFLLRSARMRGRAAARNKLRRQRWIRSGVVGAAGAPVRNDDERRR